MQTLQATSRQHRRPTRERLPPAGSHAESVTSVTSVTSRVSVYASADEERTGAAGGFHERDDGSAEAVRQARTVIPLPTSRTVPYRYMPLQTGTDAARGQPYQVPFLACSHTRAHYT